MVKVLESRGLSNTPAERTSLPAHTGRGIRILIDWLGFTITSEEYSITNVLELFEFYLGIEKNVWSPGRRFYEGYQDSFVFENINIYYNGAENQGIHVDITGQGCRFLEIIYQKLGVQPDLGWYDFIKYLKVYEEVKFTRIDIACDDFIGFFTIPMLLEKLEQGHAKSKFKSWHPDGRRDFDGNYKGGITIYYGSPQSRLQCTMYEKNKQLGLDYFWQRTELRFNKQRAEDIAMTIIQHCDPEAETTKDIGLIFAGVLKEYLTFLEPKKTDSNKRRWNVSPFWSNFLAGVQPLKFASCLPDRDITKIHTWIEKQVSKGLTMLRFAYHDNNEEWLEKLYSLGASKLTNEDIRIIKDYRRLIDYMDNKENNLLENDIFTQKNESSWDEDSSD